MKEYYLNKKINSKINNKNLLIIEFKVAKAIDNLIN